MPLALTMPPVSSPLLRALGAQGGGIAVAIAYAAGSVQFAGTAPAGWQWLLVQAVAAALFAGALRLEWWWWFLSLAFGPALAAAFAVSIPPMAWGLLLALLLAAYGGTQRTRVPLYLSNAAAVAAFIDLVPAERPLKVLDLGCGTGTILSALSRRRPHVRCEGVERAPLPWMIARVRGLLSRPRFGVTWGSLWAMDLSDRDVVYAYLSPAPMAQLWEKARREMRPGSLLVSFRFEIPGVVPDMQVGVGTSRLYAWRM